MLVAHNPCTLDAERVRIRGAARITGLHMRTIQHLARTGRIPGAALLASCWTFDVARLRAWIKDAEDETSRQAPKRTAVLSGPGFRFEGATTDGLYERLLRLRP